MRKKKRCTVAEFVRPLLEVLTACARHALFCHKLHIPKDLHDILHYGRYFQVLGVRYYSSQEASAVTRTVVSAPADASRS